MRVEQVVRTARNLLLVLALALVATVLIAVGARLGVDREASATPAGRSSSTTVEASSSTTAAPATTVAPTTTTTAPPVPIADVPADVSLGQGDDGPEVLQLQQRLTELGFWLGEPDGGYGSLTAQAVMAFQKASGLARDGTAGPATRAALVDAAPPIPSSTADGIEIDLARQLLFVIEGGEVRWVVNTSTGTPRTPTPRGTFAVEREVDGVRRAPLGDLYRPKYFHGGVAIHGSPSIPAQPASHGCARVSNAAMDHLWRSGLVEIGTEVRVV